jgi:hypothetical protein
MQLAADPLLRTDLYIARLAARVGYGSEPAFQPRFPPPVRQRPERLPQAAARLAVAWPGRDQAPGANRVMIQTSTPLLWVCSTDCTTNEVPGAKVYSILPGSSDSGVM